MSIYKEGIAFHFFVIACKVVKITTPSFHSLNQIIPIEQARAGALSKRSHSKLFQGNSILFAKVGLNALYWFIIHSWNRTIIRLLSLVFGLIPSLASFTVCKLVTSKKNRSEMNLSTVSICPTDRNDSKSWITDTCTHTDRLQTVKTWLYNKLWNWLVHLDLLLSCFFQWYQNCGCG